MPNDTTPLKTCTKCGNVYPATPEFYYSRGDSFQNPCKRCFSEYSKRRYQEHRDEILNRVKEYRIANAEQVRDYKHRYQVDNSDTIREKKHQYYLAHRQLKGKKQLLTPEERRHRANECARRETLKHPDRVHERKLRHYKKDIEKSRQQGRASTNIRRARVRSAAGTHTAAELCLQMKAQTDKRGRMRCWWCSDVIKGAQYHVDHRIPLSRGGSNAPENLCISCQHCNGSKGAKLPQEWGDRLL